MIRKIVFEIETELDQEELETWALKLIKQVAVEPDKCKIIQQNNMCTYHKPNYSCPFFSVYCDENACKETPRKKRISVNDIMYEVDHLTFQCNTPCNKEFTEKAEDQVFVGSIFCKESCTNFVSCNEQKQIVKCSHEHSVMKK